MGNTILAKYTPASDESESTPIKIQAFTIPSQSSFSSSTAKVVSLPFNAICVLYSAMVLRTSSVNGHGTGNVTRNGSVCVEQIYSNSRYIYITHQLMNDGSMIRIMSDSAVPVTTSAVSVLLIG